eukprot:XP_024441592.1 uncharacterized protein LOC112324175 [Populus trichocarpa]
MAKNKKRSKTSSSNGKDLLHDYSPIPERDNAIIALDEPLASLPNVVPQANTPDLHTLTGGDGFDAGTLKDGVLVGGSSPVISPLPSPGQSTEPANGQLRDIFSSNRSTSGWLIYKFNNEEDKLSVLSGGSYLVYGRPLVLKSTPEYFDFASSEMTTVSVWVKFPNLPLRCWSATCLSKIASVIGKPLQSDMLTSIRSRLSYARVLIELDLMVDLPPSINITLPNIVDLVQKVVYETLPKFCKHCRVLRHTTSACSKAPANVEKYKMDHVGNATRGKEASVMETPLEPTREGKMVEEHTLNPMLAEVSVDGWETIKSRKNNNKKQRPQARGPVIGSNRVENQLASYKGKELGLNSPLKQHEVASLMKRNKIDVCGLLEMKLSSSKVAFMQKFLLKNWKFVSNAEIANTARIVLLWNPSTISIEVINLSAQARRALWEDLKRWCPSSPWIVLGDFNSILSQDDKHNGEPVSSYEVPDFRECCADLGLADLNATGCHFTWSSGSVWSKIDRVMVNPLWFSSQMQTHVHFCTLGAFSDHSPTSIKIGLRPLPGKRNLKFFNMVARAEADLDRHQTLLQMDRDNNQLLTQDKLLRLTLINLKSTEKMFFSQKLKNTFFKESDKGTHFFHSLMNHTHKRNYISTIQRLDGMLTTSISEVGEEFIRYYRELLGTSKHTTSIDVKVALSGPCINAGSHSFLLAPVSNDSIKEALFSIGNDKAPGPDGYSSLFFKTAWDMVGNDLCAAIRDFFVSGRLLKQVNHSVIALMPKSDNVTFAADFRPISCCNVIYKVISKILAVCSLDWIFVALADDFHVPAWKSSWFAVGSLPMAEWCLRELSLYMVSAWFELIQRGPFVPMCMSCCLLLSAGGRWLVVLLAGSEQFWVLFIILRVAAVGLRAGGRISQALILSLCLAMSIVDYDQSLVADNQEYEFPF